MSVEVEPVGLDRCARERCPRRPDPGRGDGYCSPDCAYVNALVTPSRGFPARRGVRPVPEPDPEPCRRCGRCRLPVLLVHGPRPGQARLVDLDPRAGGTMVLRGDQVIAELRGRHAGAWGDYSFAAHACPPAGRR